MKLDKRIVLFMFLEIVTAVPLLPHTRSVMAEQWTLRMNKNWCSFLTDKVDCLPNAEIGIYKIGTIERHTLKSFEARSVFICIHRPHLLPCCGNSPVVVLHEINDR